MPKFKYIHEAQYSVTIAFFEKFKNTIIFYFIFYLIILLNLFILLAFSNIIRLIKNYTGKIFYIIIFPLFISILSYLLKFSLFIIKLKSFNSLYYYYSIFEDNIYFTSYFIIILSAILIKEGHKYLFCNLTIVFLSLYGLLSEQTLIHSFLSGSGNFFKILFILLFVFSLFECSKYENKFKEKKI